MTILKNDNIYLKIIHLSMLFAILVSPVMNAGELVYLILNWPIIDQSEIITPIYIKIIKDITFVVILFTAIMHMFITKNKIHSAYMVGIVYVMFICVYPIFYTENIVIYMSGIRWIMPMLLIIFLIPYISREFLQSLTNLLFYVFMVHFCLQIIELFSVTHFHTYLNGLSRRNPGMFLIPNSGALFTLFVLFFHLFYSSIKKRYTIISLSFISIFLTQSGMGIITYFVIMLIFLLSCTFFKLLPFLAIILFLLYPAIFGLFVNRYATNDYVGQSFGTRIDIFIDKFLNANLLDNDLGLGTNTAVLILKDSLYKVSIMDSMYASLVTNLGILNFIVILFTLLTLTFTAFVNKKKERLIFYILILLSSSTTIIFEVYPVNLLISIMFAYYINQYIFKKTNEVINNPQ